MIMVIENLMGREVNYLLGKREKLNNVVGLNNAPISNEEWKKHEINHLSYKWKECKMEQMDEELYNLVFGKYNDGDNYRFKEDKCSKGCIVLLERKFLFHKNGIYIYKEHMEEDEDGFVSFMGLHSIATKGDSAVITMEQIEEFCQKLDAEASKLYPTIVQNEYIIDTICQFLTVVDDVESSHCPSYAKLSEEDKEEYSLVADQWVRIKCEEGL